MYWRLLSLQLENFSQVLAQLMNHLKDTSQLANLSQALVQLVNLL